MPLVLDGTTGFSLPIGAEIGIGTTTPAGNGLHVDHTAGATLRLTRLGTSTSHFVQLETDGAHGTLRSEGNLTLQSGGANPRITVLSSGNIGIGTTNPSQKLEVLSGVNTIINSKTSTSTTLGGFTAYGNSTSHLKVFQFGSSYGGTTFAGLTGNNQSIIEAQDASSLVIATQGGTPDIVFAPSRTARMTIKNDGNVGIGDTLPDNKMNIKESALGSRSASNSNTSLTIEHATDTGIQFFSATQTQLRFGDAASTGAGSIIYTHSDNTLKFNTSEALALTIDGSGDVGIGTDNPSEKFVVHGDGARMIVSSNDYEVAMLGRRGSSGAALDGGYLRLREAGVNKVILDTSGNSYLTGGNVGIGTSSPTSPLHVNSAEISNGQNKGIKIDNFNSSKAYSLRTGITGSENTSLSIHDDTAGASRITINTSGNIGIGTSVPASWARLDILGSAGSQVGANQAMQIKAPSATPGQGVGIRLSASSGSHEAVGIIGMVNNPSGNAGAMTFHTYNLGATIPEQMRIDNLGNVGIGDTDPDRKLVVKGGAVTQLGKFHVIDDNNSNATSNPLHINYSTLQLVNSYSGASPSANGTKVAKLAFSTVTSSGYGATCSIIGLATSGGYNSGAMAFNTGSDSSNLETERMRIDRQGNVGIGVTDPTEKLTLNVGNGGGILQSTYYSNNATSGQKLGVIGFKGYSQGNTVAGADAKIEGVAASNHSGTSAPAHLDFYTKDDSIGPGSGATRRFRIDEYGAAVIHASKNNWSRLMQSDNTNIHYRLYGASSSTTTYDILRYRRHYWGSGSVHITLFQTYYSTTSQGEYWLTGHGRSDGSYSPSYGISYQDIYNGPGSSRLSYNLPGGSPGNSAAEIVDVRISIPAYVYYLIKIQVSHSQWYPSTATMPSSNSYALHA